jgi:protein involved in polysaccharide export with SLBB domain
MKRIVIRTHLLLLQLLVVALAAAQAPTGAYRLQPEDVIRISVYNETQITGALIPVGPDGNITAPYVGNIRAEGKTTAELEQELAELYERKLRLRNPIVSVSIERYREMRITILGAVGRPGTFPFRPGDTLLTGIGIGGGALEGRADLKRAMFRRGQSREFIPIDLDAMLFRGDTSQNFVLRDGDELIVPENRKNRVIVLGSVPRPGVVPYTDGMRLSDAIALSGFEIPRQTKFSGTFVLREKLGSAEGYTYIKTDFVKFMKKRDASQNILLEGGDIVWVPNTGAPNISEMSQLLNAAFFADRVLFRDGIFGFRPLAFIGR